jgi:photosystem II stability/assembly factor-like uncharacterized protein
VQRVGAWTGGTIVKVALSPHFSTDGIALAATLAGLFRSDDGGQSWQLSMDGLREPTLTTVIFSGSRAPEDDNPQPVAFAGTENGRLYRSDDLGRIWQECTAWAGLGVLTDLAAAPDFHQQPYLFAATIQGAFRSLDGGASWESTTFGLLDDEILCIACAPDFAASELVWCGTSGGGFYRSRNAAKAWREAGLGLPDSAVQAIVVSPHFAHDRTLYAGMEDGGLYKSEDGGESWKTVGRATELLPDAVNSLALPARPARAASVTEGDADDATLILAGTSGGVFWSADGGEHWQPAEGGDFMALDFAASADGLVIAGALSDGLMISSDCGKSWSPVPIAPAAHAPPLIVAPTSTRLFALDHDGVMAQSVDGGAAWSTLPGGIDEGPVADLPIFAHAAGIQHDGSLALYAADETHLLRGITQAEHAEIAWEVLTLPDAGSLGGSAAPLVVASPTFAQTPSVLWGHYTGDIYLSNDGGATWELTARPWSGEMTLSMTMSPSFASDGRLVAITGRQAVTGGRPGHFQISIRQSYDAGASWADLAGLETETPAVLVALPKDDPESSILLATRNRLIRLFAPAPFTHNGNHANDLALEAHQTLFSEDSRVTALAVSPTFHRDQMVLAGIDDPNPEAQAAHAHLHVSHDAGATWTAFDKVPDGSPIVSLILDSPSSPETEDAARQRGITVVTLGGAVWRCPWPGT